jgi:hypothetical protein
MVVNYWWRHLVFHCLRHGGPIMTVEIRQEKLHANAEAIAG